MTVKVFKATKSAIDKLESRLQKEFERRALKLNITIRGGTKGNLPTKADAVDILYTAWKGLSEPEKARIVKEYIDSCYSIRRHLQNSRPEETDDVR